MDKFFNSYREMISLRGLTDHTLKSYCTYIRAYLNYLSDVLHKQPENVSWEELRDFICWIQEERGLAYVPSLEDTLFFIDTIPDIKQKAMVALMYSSGLRIGEVCHLRYEDISRTHMRVHIRNSKSRDDRYAILSQKALDILTQYWQECDRPRGWLFPKQHDPDRPIDTFFLSWHIHEHEERLGWERKLTCHSFRHALGTHLYESGADLLTIKAILGHKSILSTTIYVHLASNNLRHVNNPFDSAGGVSNV